jgi:hypothetical protein
MIRTDNIRQIPVIVRQNHNHAIDIKNQKWVGNSQIGRIIDLDDKTYLEIWPTACSVEHYGDNSHLLNVLVVTGVTYEKFKEKDSNGYYGKYHFKYSKTYPYLEALKTLSNGIHPKLNSAPIRKK